MNPGKSIKGISMYKCFNWEKYFKHVECKHIWKVSYMKKGCWFFFNCCIPNSLAIREKMNISWGNISITFHTVIILYTIQMSKNTKKLFKWHLIYTFRKNFWRTLMINLGFLYEYLLKLLRMFFIDSNEHSKRGK